MNEISLPFESLFNMNIKDLEVILTKKFTIPAYGNKPEQVPPREDMILLLLTAHEYNLSPLKREIELIPFMDKWTVHVGLEGLLTIAHRSNQFAGFQPIEYLHPAHGWLDYWAETNSLPIAIRATVRKLINGHIFVNTSTVYMKEFNKSRALWTSMPIDMLTKKGMKHAIKTMWGTETAGLDIDADSNSEDGEYIEAVEVKDWQADFNKWFKPQLDKFPILDMFVDWDLGIETKEAIAQRKQMYYDLVCKSLINLPIKQEARESYEKYINGGRFTQEKWTYVVSEYAKIFGAMNTACKSIMDTCDSLATTDEKVAFLREKYAERPNLFAFMPFANWLYGQGLGELVLNQKGV